MSDTTTATDTTIKLEMPRPWKVVLHNDDYTPMDFVTALLIAVFNKDEAQARRLTIDIHERGYGIAGLYTKEVALSKTLKAREIAARMQHPLLITAERDD